MTRYIALLRGVNLGGHNKVAMADLRALLSKMGLADVQTVLQSGNAVFGCAAKSCAALERSLEAEVEKRLKLKIDFHVRTAGEWRAVIDANPFPAEAQKDPGHLLLTCFKSPLEPVSVEALRDAIEGREILQADGRHLYMYFPDGIGRSKAAPLVEKKLTARGTARNWNTVLKLAELSNPEG